MCADIAEPAAPAAPAAPVWAVKIDYLSICSPLLIIPNTDPYGDEYEPFHFARVALSRLGVRQLFADHPDGWAFGGGRGGYSRSVRHPIGLTLFYGHPISPPLVECGGAACDALNASSELLGLAVSHCEAVTRIDLAGDLCDEISPEAFLAFGRSTRHAAHAADDSATGSTRYVGSPSSDRRLRVYRYYPPHPRAAFLRVEVMLRRDLAKSAAAALADARAPQVWQAAAGPFDLKAPQWRLPANTLQLQRTMRNEPTAASRLRWLIKQIKPAVLDAHRAGLINIASWLEEALSV